VELPPYEIRPAVGLEHEAASGLRRGRLDPKSRWFLPTPCQLVLREGKVIAEITNRTVSVDTHAMAIERAMATSARRSLATVAYDENQFVYPNPLFERREQ